RAAMSRARKRLREGNERGELSAVPPNLSAFVSELDRLVDGGQPDFLYRAAAAMKRYLLADDGWLPAPYRRPHPMHYQQYLLYRDALSRLSIVSFVWGP